jgi:serine/threonine-protein kinase PknK
LKFARGDKTAADLRLAEGVEIAKALQLSRLEAALVYEQVRVAGASGHDIDVSLAQRVRSQGAQALDGIGDVTTEFREDSQIRVLLVEGESSALADACSRARIRRDRIDQRKRPRAHLRASLQLAFCLTSAGRREEASQALAPALRTCAALGLSRLILDEGPMMVRLAKETVPEDEFSATDPAMAENVRDFVLALADTPTV